MKTKIKTRFSNVQPFCNWFPFTATNGAMKESKQPEARNKQQIQFEAVFMFLLLSMFLLSGCNSVSNGESNILRELRATELILNGNSEFVQTSYFFYPSTMRMVNIDNLPNWNEAIKEVRRLSVLSMWSDRFDQAKQTEIVGALEAKENFSIYAEMDDKYSNFKLLGRKNGSEAVLIYNDSTVNYVVHLLGKINYVKLMKLSADLREMETKGTGIEFLTKAMGKDKNRAASRRRYYDRRKKREAAEQLRKDSIEAANQAIENLITE